jgi:hypothetical protein
MCPAPLNVLKRSIHGACKRKRKDRKTKVKMEREEKGKENN